MPGETIERWFRETGAFLTGHFKLTSGRHSDVYLEKFAVLQHPEYLTRLCAALAGRFAGSGVETVVGPLTGGAILAYDVARYLEARFIFPERVEGRMAWRRGFAVRRGERILVVEDVVTTGGSVGEVLALLREDGAAVVGVAALVDRSGGAASFGVPFEPLWRVEAESWAPEECPLCARGVPLTQRGSRGLGQGR
ncbi:MAG: orotate phosphoribosyltransferase [Bacillota bacterium]|nr:orotate phosphoribosyltransferase [Bacillota bacterium]